MMKYWAALLFGVVLSGCMTSTGPRVRVATATAAELKAVEDQEVVWYEFQPGDVIPVDLAFFGVMEGGAQQPVAFRTKQRFFFVMSKNGPMRLSFDGESIAQSNTS